MAEVTIPSTSALHLLLASIPVYREKIGKVEGSALAHAMATRIGQDTDGRACFVAETPVLHWGWQDRGHQFGGARWIDVHRYELKVAYSQADRQRADDIQLGRGTGILQDDWMLVAKLPLSLGRVAWVRLKPTYRDKVSDKDRPPEAARDCAESLWAWLDDLPYDYWETDSSLKTAAFRTFEPAPTLVETLRNSSQATGVALGICTNPWGTFEAIKNTDDYRRLLDDAKAAKGRERWDRHRANGKGPKTIELNDPALLDHAPELLELSLRQAMAGPDNAPPNSLKLLGNPVMLKARWIFDDHIKRLNDRVPSSGLSADQLHDAEQPRTEPSPEDDAELDNIDIGPQARKFLYATLNDLLNRDEWLEPGQDGAIVDLFVRVDRLALSPDERLQLTGELATCLIDSGTDLEQRLVRANQLLGDVGA